MLLSHDDPADLSPGERRREVAATTVIMRARREDPLYQQYQQLLDGGTKPNLAKLSIARQIASIILSMWRSEEVYNSAKLKKMA